MQPNLNPWQSTRIPHSWEQALSLLPVIAYRGAVNPSGRHTRAAHRFYTWWWIERGAVHLTTEQDERTIPAGQWVFIPCGLWREQRFTEDAELISINFMALWRMHLPLVQAREMMWGGRESLPGLLEAAQSITETLKPLENGEEVSLSTLPLARSFELTSGLYRLVSLLFSEAVTRGATLTPIPSPDARVEWVLKDLHINLQAGPLPFNRWQARTKLSRSQLERLGRHHLGRSLHAYRDDLLATAACRSLTTERLLVKEVAENFGFVDTAHFCRWLRAHTGQTPAALQKGAVV